MKNIIYTRFRSSDFEQLLDMGQKLWPDFKGPELERLLRQTTQSDKHLVLITKDALGDSVGFSIFSIRGRLCRRS